MPRRAFTLIEMLLVVAVIALLIAILLPALTRSREMVRRVTCASNQAQVGAAFITYANNCRGWFPANAADQTGYGPALFERENIKPISMVLQMRPYVASFDFFRCPSVPEAAAPDHPGNTSNWNVWGFWYLGNYRHAGGVYTSKVTRNKGDGNWTIYGDIIHNRGWLGGPFHTNHVEYRASTNLVQKADNPSARWYSVANEIDLAGGNFLTIAGAVRWHSLSELQKIDHGSVWHWYGGSGERKAMQSRKRISIAIVVGCFCFAGLVEGGVAPRCAAAAEQDEEWVTIHPLSPKHADRFAALLAKEGIDFYGQYKSRLIMFHVRRTDQKRSMQLFVEALKKEKPAEK